MESVLSGRGRRMSDCGAGEASEKYPKPLRRGSRAILHRSAAARSARIDSRGRFSSPERVPPRSPACPTGSSPPTCTGRARSTSSWSRSPPHGRPRAVIIGGDLGPHAARRRRASAHQRVFLEGFLVEFARRAARGRPRERAAAADGQRRLGREPRLPRAPRRRAVALLHDRVDRGGRRAGGGPLVGADHAVRAQGLGALGGRRRGDAGAARRLGEPRRRAARRTASIPTRREPTIADALDDAGDAHAARRDTVFVLHSPPRDTRCDMIGARPHVGSRAIRAFVERHQPPLVLSGPHPRVAAGLVVVPRRDRRARWS